MILKRIFQHIRLFLFLSLSLYALPSIAEDSAIATLPKDIKASSYLVEDVQSGSVLANFNATERIEPASLTKLMTAYLTFEALKIGKIKNSDMVKASEKARKIEGSRMFVDPKVPVSIEDLVKGMIVQSGNDACIVLADTIAGSEEAFVKMMNDKAAKMGLKNTHFENSTGLPGANHYSTAMDLSKLATNIMKDFPEYYPIYSMKEFTYNKIKQRNRNDLLFRDSNVDGIKTGHTKSAGYNLVASTHRNGRRVLSVLIGSDSSQRRASDSGKLLNWGIDEFTTKKIFSKDAEVSTASIYKGSVNKVSLGFADDIYVTVPNDMKGAKASVSISYKEPLLAPVKKGQKIATANIMLNGKDYAQKDLVALDDVKGAGWLGRTWDTIVLWVKSIF